MDFFLNHWLLSSLFVLIVAALAFIELGGGLLGFASLTTGAATLLMNRSNKLLIIDVRDKNAYAKGHIRDAVNIPLPFLAERLIDHKDQREGDVLVVCDHGQESAKACAVLKKAAFASLNKLSGGMQAWHDAHLPIVKKKK